MREEYFDDDIDCWNCGGSGLDELAHECGDDTCCCLDPEPGICDICKGKGSWPAPRTNTTNHMKERG